MPAPGDQHRATPATINPYEDHVPRINEFTAQDIATLQSRLERQLGPEFISARPGAGGGKVYYLAAEKVINLANEVFGFNGWSSQIQNVQVDFCDENQDNGKITLGLSTVVRVTLKDGTFHEDVGYGHIENCKGKAAAFEKAKKEAATDALKRALRNFGNVLGNCLYDKEYLSRITKLKVAPSKWDADNLHRHPDYAPIKKESIAGNDEKPASLPNGHAASSNGTDCEDEFGGNLFDEVEMNQSHPDEVVVDPAEINNCVEKTIITSNELHPPQIRLQDQRMAPPRRPTDPPPPQPALQRERPAVPIAKFTALNGHSTHSEGVESLMSPFQGYSHQPPRVQNSNLPSPTNYQPRLQNNSSSDPPAPQNNQPNSAHSTPPNQRPEHIAHQRQHLPQHPPQHPQQQTPQPNLADQPRIHHIPPIGFMPSRAATLLTNTGNHDTPPPANIAATLPRFNPNAESPSIRRTSGVNHGASAPIMRQNVAPNNTNTNTTLNGPTTNTNPTTNTPPQNPSAPISNPLTNRPTPATNFINPSADLARKIGMPGAAVPSPLANRTAYKPPGPAIGGGIKRPFVAVPSTELHGSTGVGRREPLADVSNTAGNVAHFVNGEIVGGEEAKRIRMAEG